MKLNKKKLNAITKTANKEIKTDIHSDYFNNDDPLLFQKTHYSEDFIIRNKK